MADDVGLAYIRGYYRVPAHKGRQVTFAFPKGTVRTGTIVGSSGPHLLVDFGDRIPEVLHPTWEVSYLDSEASS